MSWLHTLLAVSVTIAVVIFIQGFLPLKQRVSGHGKDSCCRAPRFNKTVLVVVDALRTDFVTARADSWPYLQRLVATGNARIYDAQVHPPTVTLPRIKALISGDIPGFIDVVMNFDSSELLEDNILYQMKAAGKSSVFYGDDTWLRLFPQTFIRSEGTTSFFVSDYTEVDDNVTRHITSEMARDDWHMMILHYLGLDHIGHLIGPSSSLLPPKLSEMDRVIELIHSTFVQQGVKDYLIVLCGDHGMADQGGHGGVTPSEIATPMVFISDAATSPSDSIGQIYQIDLVPTLSVLLNLPIPQNSLGVVSTSVLEPLMVRQDVLNALRDNSNQLYRLLRASSAYKSSAQIVSQYEMVVDQHKSHDPMSADPMRQQKLVTDYQQVLTSMRQQLASHLVDYDITAMIYGLCMLFTAFCCLYVDHQQWSATHIVTLTAGGLLAASIHYTHCTSKSYSHVLCMGGLGALATALYVLMGVACFTSLLFMPLRLLEYINKSTANHLSTLALPLVHSLSLLSSSYIEEEHQTMYYFSCSLVIVSLVSVALTHRTSADLSRLLAVLVCMTLARKWNQTGDKWAHLPDIADLLNTPSYQHVKFVLAIASLLLIALISVVSASHRNFSTACGSITKGVILLSLASTAIYVSGDCGLPTISHRGHYEANSVYCCCSILLASAVYNWCMRSYITSVFQLKIAWVLLTTLLHRTVNLPLMALIITMEYLLSQSSLSSQFAVQLYYWLGHTSFFYQGNSNSLSSVDISAGYKGLSSYSPVFTGFFMLCNAYSGTIFWLLSIYVRIQSDKSRQKMGDVAKMFLGFKLMDMLVLQILIILERYHLFVWTVFAPKLVYEVLTLAVFLLNYVICNSLQLPLSIPSS